MLRMSVQDLKKVEKTVKDALNKLGEEYPGKSLPFSVM